jgi:hypothetical protein
MTHLALMSRCSPADPLAMGGRRGVRACAIAAVAVIGIGSIAAGAQASGRSSTRHPSHNITAKPSYNEACARYRSNSTGCITKALAAIDRARAMEHVRPMILPDNFATLSYAEQTFVVTNLERVDRGLAPFRGITARLNRTATQAAVAQVDPAPAYSAIGQFVLLDYQSNWTSNFGPLAGDYGWMYDDGYGSYNVDCPTRSASGCWGHRDIILTTYDKPDLISGVGSNKRGGLLSIAQLFVAGEGQHPKLTYSWRQALRHGADGHS